MSKKDYQAIARAIHETMAPRCPELTCERAFTTLSGNTYGCPVHGIREGQWNAPHQLAINVIHRLSVTFKADNPRFNEEMFREACETGKTRGMRQ